ncbi:hypothetical protein HUR95_15890 [Caldalkalibacillus thermarum TA2.A1]|uniref:Uncharacterized protein n=1 Tax=Caldalkalibacillus thermarum (strain TA2.A1) TaxID=986075 RepID=A0A8X8LAM3_CALTT|nr:hypothetical protein [Caldalkalibacillus thermarum]QZT33684.1 hypothetical protein HUR95_15890 [Caldalkalibacillus thermarum TA2.A1]
MKKEEDKVVIKETEVVKKYSLDELLEKVTPENIHKEINLGKARGKEVW